MLVRKQDKYTGSQEPLDRPRTQARTPEEPAQPHKARKAQDPTRAPTSAEERHPASAPATREPEDPASGPRAYNQHRRWRRDH
jgi:hypothetical protein